MDNDLCRKLVRVQANEITEHHVYKGLARRERSSGNRDILGRIGSDELRHYEFWAARTGVRPRPKMPVVWAYLLGARVLGVTFIIKLMEKGEERAQKGYASVTETIPAAAAIIKDEQEHENELTAMIDEERLRYVGSVVLGLSDALVEFTGALAGFTLALQNNRLIAVIGLITGVAAALSMAASEYLSTKSDQKDTRSPAKAALYTGSTYIATVFILVGPFLLLGRPLPALMLTLTGALALMLAFSYYISVAKDLPFWRRFLEMAGISLGVAAVSFGIGYLLRLGFGVDA